MKCFFESAHLIGCQTSSPLLAEPPDCLILVEESIGKARNRASNIKALRKAQASQSLCRCLGHPRARRAAQTSVPSPFLAEIRRLMACHLLLLFEIRVLQSEQ